MVTGFDESIRIIDDIELFFELLHLPIFALEGTKSKRGTQL